MKIEWDDIDQIDEGIISTDCWLDPTSGHFTETGDGYPFLHAVRPRLDERHAWGASMMEPERATVVRARYLMQELRARRAEVAELQDRSVADKLLRVLDDEGSAEQADAVAAYAAGRRTPEEREEVRARYAALMQTRADREDAILWALRGAQFAADEHELATLRLRVFDFELKRSAPLVLDALREWQHLAYRSAIWEWAERLREKPTNEPPWLAEVLAWRDAEEARRQARVAQLIGRLDRALASQAPSLHASLPAGAEDADERFDEWLPAELIQLWQWRDGAAEIIPVGYGYSLHSIDEALELRAARCEAFAESPHWWHPHWIPIASDPSGNSIVLGAFDGDEYQVLGFWHDDQDRDVLAYDVEGLLDTLVAMYEAKLFARSDDADDDELSCASMWDYSVFWRRRNGIRHPTFRVESPK